MAEFLPNGFRNPFHERAEAYSKLPNLALTMTEDEILADWDMKQKQRGKSDSPDHVKKEWFVSRITGKRYLI